MTEKRDREVPTIDEAVERARVEYHRHGFGMNMHPLAAQPVAFCRCGETFMHGETTLFHQYERHLFRRVLGFAVTDANYEGRSRSSRGDDG